MRSICVMSGKAIRHARFNTGWAKGVFFHEYYHSLSDDNNC